MAKDFSAAFYKSATWQKCRNDYAASQGWLCEECRKKGLIVPGEIVHHIVELEPGNINDQRITLGWDNLRLLCRECHAEVHGFKKTPSRYRVDEMGRVTIKE